MRIAEGGFARAKGEAQRAKAKGKEQRAMRKERSPTIRFALSALPFALTRSVRAVPWRRLRFSSELAAWRRCFSDERRLCWSRFPSRERRSFCNGPRRAV